MAKKRVRPGPKQAPLALGLAPGAERVLVLGRERDRLITQVGQKKRLLERCEAEAERAREALAERLAPLAHERRELDRETHAWFDKLLAPGHLPKRKREKVISIYFWLQEEQLISPRPVADGPEPRAHRVEEEGGAAPGEEEASRVASASKVEGLGRDALRGLFKRLAVALHPDRARTEADRARLTEVMKEVTRAYEAQDLACLLEIERSHRAPDVSVGATDERVRWLEQAIEELRRQLRELGKTIKNFKRTEPYAIARELAEASEQTLEEFQHAAQAELTRLRAMRDHVRAFFQGKLSWERFVEGPPPPPMDEDALEELLNGFLIECAPAKPRGKRRRRPPSDDLRRGG